MRKIAIAAAIIFIVLIALFTLRPQSHSGANQTNSTHTFSTLTAAKTPLTSATQSAITAVTPPPESQKTANQFTELPTAQLPDAKDEPLWGVEIGPIPAGKYDYQINVDGEYIRLSQMSYRTGRNQFTFPPAADQKLQKQIGPDRIQFYHVGKIQRFAWFISSFTESEWGLHEMQPLNEAAKANLRDISADSSLAKAEGVVVDSANRPIPNARVLVRQNHQFERVAQCNQAGQFFVERLPHANLTFHGKGWGYCNSDAVSIGPDASGKFPPVKIVLEPGVVIIGRVRDEMGQPVPMASISAYPTKPQSHSYHRMASPVRTDKAGAMK